MSQTTYIDAALDRVNAERRAAGAKRAGMESFVDRVADVSAASSPAEASGVAGAGGLARRREGSGGGCESVRTAFAETVHPHVVAGAAADAGTDTNTGTSTSAETGTDAGAGPDASPESGARPEPEASAPLTAAIRRELTESIAVALSPASTVAFSPGLKRGVIAEAERRRDELDVLCRALDRESASLRAAEETVEAVASWIAAADETPLTELGFDALRVRHERLETHRERCDTAAADRQAVLASTTAVGANAGLRHRDLLGSVYEGFAVDHPVLSTLVRLDDACRECQRSVRAHLVRRA